MRRWLPPQTMKLMKGPGMVPPALHSPLAGLFRLMIMLLEQSFRQQKPTLILELQNLLS